MALPYYVEPEYWLEGYAVGDAISASCQMASALAFAARAVEKWEPLPPTPEIWADAASASGAWAPAAGSAGSWIDAGSASGIWAPVASSGKTWQDAP